MTTREEIGEWFDRGVADGATHMIVVCDTFSYEDYPVYVSATENVIEVRDKYNGPNMQRVMEVYSLKKNKEEQLSRNRCFEFGS